MRTARFFRHPLSIVFLTLFLAAAPSAFIPYSYLYKNFSLAAQPFVLLAAAIIFLVLIPVAIIRFVYSQPLTAFGWRLPEDTKETRKLIIVSLLAFLPIILFFSTQDIFRLYYSSYGISIELFLLKGVLLTLLYYLAEEFLFHGFFFFALWHRLRYHSYWIVSGLFAFLHITKPPQEIAFSFFASMVFCHLSYRTKSFIPAAIVHFTIGLALNILATFVWYDSLKALFLR